MHSKFKYKIIVLFNIIALFTLSASYSSNILNIPAIHITQPTLQQTLSKAAKKNNIVIIQNCLQQLIASYEADEQGLTALMYAAKSGNIEIMQALLANPAIINLAAEINKTDQDHSSALIYAASGGHDEAARILLEHNADAFIKNSKGMSAAMLAASENHLNIIQMLLNKDARLIKQKNLGYDVLMYAANNKHGAIVKLILSKHKNSMQFKDILAEFILAAVSGDTQLIHKYLNHQALLAHNGYNYYSAAIMLAAANDYSEIVEILLTKVDIDDTLFGWDISMHAIQNNHITLADKLLEKMHIYDSGYQDICFRFMRSMSNQKASKVAETTKKALSKNSDYKIIALKFAIVTNNVDVVNFLLDNDQIDKKTINEHFLLAHAASNKQIETIKLLLKHGAEINNKNKSGISALMIASINGYDSIIKYLIAEGADINATDKDGNNALMLAVSKGRTDIAKYLVSINININQQNNKGRTALMLTYRLKNYELADFLIKAGADTTLKDKESYGLSYYITVGNIESIKAFGLNIHEADDCGNTVLMFATMNNNKELVNCLLQEGVDVNLTNRYGQNALLFAVANKNQEIVEILCAHDKTNTNIKHLHNGRMNALMIAAKNGCAALVKYFLTKGLDTNQTDINGMNALMLATIGGHKEVVEIILHTTKNDAKHKSDSDIDTQKSTSVIYCDQAKILKRLKIYLRAKHAAIPLIDKNPRLEKEAQDFFNKFSPDDQHKTKEIYGHCNGISALWLYFQYLQTQGTNITNQGDKIDWFYATISLILTKIGENNFALIDLTLDEQIDIDRFIHFIELLQHPWLYKQTTQGNLASSFKALDETMDLKREYSITTFCNPDQLAVLLSTSGMIQNQRMIFISAGRHATALFCANDENQKIKIYAFDSNRFSIPVQSFNGDINKLAKFIFTAHGLNRQLDIISLQEFSFANKSEFKHLSQGEIIDNIQKTTRFISIEKQDEFIQKTISCACASADHESLRYLLEQLNNIPSSECISNYINSIARTGCQESAKVILEFIQKKNGDIAACDNAVSFLLMAFKYNHIELIDFTLDFLQKHNEYTLYIHIREKLQESSNHISLLADKALKIGNFNTVDKIFLYFLNSKMKLTINVLCLYNPIFFKYLMHFNLHHSKNMDFLTTDNRRDKNYLSSFLIKIQLLNALDKKTRCFFLKYYQSFDNKLLYEEDEKLKKTIIAIDQAIKDNNADSILEIIVSSLENKPGVITKQDIETFLKDTGE